MSISKQWDRASFVMETDSCWVWCLILCWNVTNWTRFLNTHIQSRICIWILHTNKVIHSIFVSGCQRIVSCQCFCEKLNFIIFLFYRFFCICSEHIPLPNHVKYIKTILNWKHWNENYLLLALWERERERERKLCFGRALPQSIKIFISKDICMLPATIHITLMVSLFQTWIENRLYSMKLIHVHRIKTV